MNTEHISFEILSRYCDGDFFPVSEKNRLEEHLRTCPICRAELAKIEKMLSFMSALSSYGISSSAHFHERAMAGIAAHRRTTAQSSRFLKTHYLPISAVAAIVVAIIGFSIFTTETLHNVLPQMTAQRAAHRDAKKSGPVIHAMQAVRAAGGTVVEVSDTYIIAEAPAASIARIQRALPRCSMQMYGYVPPQGTFAVSSGGSGMVREPSMIKMKITVK